MLLSLVWRWCSDEKKTEKTVDQMCDLYTSLDTSHLHILSDEVLDKVWRSERDASLYAGKCGLSAAKLGNCHLVYANNTPFVSM